MSSDNDSANHGRNTFDRVASESSLGGSDEQTYASETSYARLPVDSQSSPSPKDNGHLGNGSSALAAESSDPVADEKNALAATTSPTVEGLRHVAFTNSVDLTNGPAAANNPGDGGELDVVREPSYRQKSTLGGGATQQTFGERNEVDYDAANAEFDNLQRTLSKHSSVKGIEEGGLPFDVREFLTQHADNIDEDRLRRIGVIFQDLEVKGTASSQAHIETIFGALVGMIMALPKAVVSLVSGHGLHGNAPKKTILQNVSGYCRPGEMLLVLGKPGAGCSTFLRVLGNQRRSYREVNGEVSYAGIDAKDLAKHYRGEVVYNQEDDHHYPTISVRNTIDFALKSRTPSSRVVADRDQLRKDILEVLIKMFGLQRCADTIVGNAMTRGVSGGEKKRTSIAEQMATEAAVSIWDGSTRGLDASSALDYVRSLRIVADLFQRTTIVTLYQASENIYNLFDKVMLLADGRCIYFGPASQAKAYFENMGYVCPPRQTTSDFLTGITMKYEARVAPGMESKVPRTPEAFESYFHASPDYAQLQTEIADYKHEIEEERPDVNFRKNVEELRMGASKSKLRRRSPYQTTYYFQIVNTMKREIALLKGDPAVLAFRYIYNAIMAVIVGSLFYQLPPTSAGAFTRGGALFFALLFNTLMANAEVPKSFEFRPIIYKQKAFAFYHPSAQFFAQCVADIPLFAVQIVVFSVILYWMVGLQAEAGKFFFFLLVLFMTSLCLTALFRFISHISRDIHFAHFIAGVFLLFFINLTGYLIPPKDMGGWVIWIYYINPIAYGLKAVLSNEFRGLVMECVGYNLVPSGADKYNNIDNQVCTLLGSTPGDRFVRGEDYLEQTYGFQASDMWIDFVAVVCFWVLYMILTAIVVEKLEFGKGGYSTNVFKARKTKPLDFTTADKADYEGVATKEHSDEAVSTATPQDSSIAAAGGGDDSLIRDSAKGLTLTWDNVCYTVPGKKRGEGIQLLYNIFGYVQPGSMTALMGASGAGKTTLLDVLAQRKNLGKVDGDILIKGVPLTKMLRRKTGYCEQMDIHNPSTTVREALQFSAYLRQPANVSKHEKDVYVEKVIQLLEMDEIADAMVGTSESGIGLSMEERKRLTIGVELVAKPKVLFLDEPTSGLDAQASFSIVRFLRKLAHEGQSVLCTIHQPSSLLFAQFDRLLLLAPGGRTVYYGDLGNNGDDIIDYFESHGAPKCPPDANPAEYILDVVAVNNQGSINWPDTYDNSDLAKRERQALAEIVEREKSSGTGAISDDADEGKEFALNYFQQCRYVVHRNFVSYWRDPEYNVNRLLLQTMVAVMLGLCFLRLGYGSSDVQNRVMVIFQSTVLGILVINQVQPQLIIWRSWFTREEASGMYDWKAFTTGMLAVELPYLAVASTVFMVVFYWFVNLTNLADRVGYFYIAYIAFTYYSMSFGFAVAAFTPSTVIAALINPFPASMLALFCGVTIPYAAMPTFWRRWMYWINPYHYYIEGVIANDLYQQKITCKPEEFLTFVPPSGQTCQEYAGDFLAVGPGYVDNPDATDACLYCPYKVGEEFTNTLDWSFDHRWRNFGIILAFFGFNTILMCIGLKYYRANKR